MGMHPRWTKDGSIYAQTQRTIDRQYLFKPDPFIRNFIGASAARAQQKHPVKLFGLDYNTNHEHKGIGPIDGTRESLTTVAKFKQTCHRLLAEEVNRYLGREGPLFSSPSRDVECVDNESAQQQLEYALTNPAKDELTDRVSRWEGFSSYGQKKPLAAFTKSIRLVYTPLPGMEHMRPDCRQAEIRRRCRALEQQFRGERTRPVMSKAKMDKTNHRDRPRGRPTRTRKPLCHAASPAAAKAYYNSFIEFLNAYKIASASYRSGCGDVAFPSGSHKPPLIEAAA